MKKLCFLLIILTSILVSYKSASLLDKEWEEIGTAGGIQFSWRCLTKTQGELKLKNTLEHSLSVAGGFEIYDLEKAIINGEFQYDEITPQSEKITVFTDNSLQRLEFVTGIRLKKLDVKKVE